MDDVCLPHLSLVNTSNSRGSSPRAAFSPSHVFLEVNPHRALEPPPVRSLGGELAIIPASQELQLTRPQRPMDGRYSPQVHGMLTVPNVCPTCHRPLQEAEGGDTQVFGERRFTPQYFRALLPTTLTICDSPSSQQQHIHRASQLRRKVWKRRHENNKSEEKGGEAEAKTEASVSDPPLADRLSESNGYYRCYFREIQKLGNGTFGGVYLCQHVMESVSLGYFALKKIPVGDNSEYLQRVLGEVRILEEVKRHPNVVEYNHSWVDIAQIADFGPPVRCLFILMEYASEGSLDAYLERHGTALPTIAVWYFFLSAVSGTGHLHQKNILHRDLKPQNLLLTGPREKPPRVLVSDFGTAALLNELSYERTGGTGTLEYMAPELFEQDPTIDGAYLHKHTKAADVWSLGMILHYLSCDGTLPTMLPSGEVVLEVERRAPYYRPPEMVELIRAMLHRDPSKRPTCHEVLHSTVAQTILHSFEQANVHSDILQTGDTATTTRRPASTTAPTTRIQTRSSSSSSAVNPTTTTGRRGEDYRRSFQVDWRVPRRNSASATPQEGVEGNGTVGTADGEEAPLPHSPLVEVPLMLQYQKQKGRRVLSAGASRGVRGGGGGGQRMVERGTQTDYVKIVYEK